MSKSNKRAKEELIRLYGPECFIDKLHLRHDRDRFYKGKAQYKRMKQLTYHHIKEKSKGGKSTVENGAILSAENHTWFNNQPKSEQSKMNKIFQDYKRNPEIFCAELSINDNDLDIKVLKPSEDIEIELPQEIEEGIIEVEPMTPEEQARYNLYKKQRADRLIKKFKDDDINVR